MTQDFSPLAGITVIEMTHMVMGPSTGQFLALLGAEVIKVEPPEGDKTRYLTGMGRAFYPTFNRGKQSVTLDLKSEAGRNALHKLLETADVFVENFRDQSLDRMGLSPDALRARYPSMIVASCKGFLTGPYQDRTAMDEVVQMMTGMAHMTGPTGRPLRIGSSANDIMGGLFAAFGVLGALLERGNTGKGRNLRTGLFENCLLLVAQHMVQFDIEGREAPPMPDRDFSWPVYDIFETAEGRPIFIGAVTSGQWQVLCKTLGLAELLDDPGLQDKMDQIEARDRTLPLFAKAIAALPFDTLVEQLDAGGLPFSPIHRPAEMYEDPHVLRPGGLHHSELSEGGSFRAPGLPIEVDGKIPAPDMLDVAAVGANTYEVFSARGMSADEIREASGVAAERGPA